MKTAAFSAGNTDSNTKKTFIIEEDMAKQNKIWENKGKEGKGKE